MESTILINFGTDGYRGIIGDNFTFEHVGRISCALGEYLKSNSSKKVAIGYDTRFLSKEFALKSAESLESVGIDVALSDNFCPSPVLSYFVKNKGFDAGIMITASHNPFMFNGLKFKSRFGASMLQSEVKKIEKIVNEDGRQYADENNKSKKNIHDLSYADFKKDYINRIIDLTGLNKTLSNAGKDFLKSLYVVIDPMYGAGIGYLSTILKDFSVSHSSVNNTVNPAFPGLNPEPIDANLNKLKLSVKKRGIKNKFAVGFATDGDADRIGAVDCKGNFIDSHKIFTIILNYLIEEGFSGSVVKTVSVSKSIGDICGKNGINLYETPIGFKNIAELMIKDGSDVFIGGEESGGIGIASHLPERDGIFNALMLLKIMAAKQKNLNELLNDIFGGNYPYLYKRVDMKIGKNKKQILIEKIKAEDFNLPFKNKITNLNFTDGFKFEYNDGSWLLIRPSGTEPVLRIYAESKDEKSTDSLINKTIEEINAL